MQKLASLALAKGRMIPQGGRESGLGPFCLIILFRWVEKAHDQTSVHIRGVGDNGMSPERLVYQRLVPVLGSLF